MVDLFLGLDVGTTSIKGALFDAQGGLVAHASRPYPASRPAPGIVEQDPRDWVRGVLAVIEDLAAEGRADRIAAVGLCSQVNTDAFVDKEGRALAPAIVWADNRAAADAAALDAAITLEDRMAWWGAPLPVGASHVLARIAWMARERPDVYAKTAHVLSPKDYCLRALAGATVSDAMSSFFIVGLDLAYVEPLLARVPGARERLPPLKGFTETVGEMTLDASQRRVPVVAGTMDAWSGSLGAGVRRAGQGAYISGTSEILAIASAERKGAPGVVTFPKAEGLTLNAGPTQSGGDALQWWAETAGRSVGEALALAAEAKRDGAVLFLPHLDGERAPLWDAELRGAFLGVSRSAGAADLALAVLEGVALSARLLFDACDAAAGGGTQRLFHAGGGARSDLWAQIRADVLGLPLDRVAFLDVGCLGAAMMAAVGVGAYASLDEAAAHMAKVERTFEPDSRRKPRYDALYDTYARATGLLKTLRPAGREP